MVAQELHPSAEGRAIAIMSRWLLCVEPWNSSATCDSAARFSSRFCLSYGVVTDQPSLESQSSKTMSIPSA